MSTESSIRAKRIGTLFAKGASIVPDQIIARLNTVRVHSLMASTPKERAALRGNLRPALIESPSKIEFLQAGRIKQDGQSVGGAIGYADQPKAMLVRCDDIRSKVVGGAGVSGIFYAGYDRDTGAPTYTGEIRRIKTGAAAPEGEARVAPGTSPVFIPEQGDFVVYTEE